MKNEIATDVMMRNAAHFSDDIFGNGKSFTGSLLVADFLFPISLSSKSYFSCNNLYFSSSLDSSSHLLFK